MLFVRATKITLRSVRACVALLYRANANANANDSIHLSLAFLPVENQSSNVEEVRFLLKL
jgi:hypothetical protein